jgi:hypothetical protein
MCLGGVKCVPTVLILDSKQIRFSGQHALKDAIRHTTTVTSTKPKPFRWSKIADDILTSEAGFCPRHSETGHETGMYLKTRARRRPMRPSMTSHTINVGKET